jgi:predicted ATPase/DNA-binding winged helix-turn-helix (wHTH) protein
VNEVRRFSFGDYALNEARRELTRDGVPVDLGSRAMDVLLALLRRPGRIATKEEIMRDAWSGMIVAQNNLTTQMAHLRRALNDPQGRLYIQTVPGRGYRFVADMEPQAIADLPPSPYATPHERHGMPVDTSSFIGREQELSDVAARIAVRGLVTIVGAGGVGKTRMALKAAAAQADNFADGIMLLELAPLTEPGRVAEALCRKLGVPMLMDRSPTDAAVSVLRGRKMLLVLDNAEHLLAAIAALVEPILRHCPGVRMLVTSREALGVAGEVTYPLPSLSVPPTSRTLTAADALRSEAVQLFADRAADALGSYTLSDQDAPAVATICRRLDGMPLAMELVAARLRMLNPVEIAARLENVFRLLNVGSRTALPRHQTLFATIDWSFSLLSSAEQIVLRRLSVFVDGCTLDGAMAVCTCDIIGTDSVFDLLTKLVGKSLVIAETSGPATRYRMLETTRQYAAEKLAAAHETGRRQRMAEYLLELFSLAEMEWPTTSTDHWVAAYGVEAENFRAAVDWAFAAGDTALGFDLVACAGALADEKSLQGDLRRWTDAALPHLSPATGLRTAASVLYLHTALEKRQGAQAAPPERARAIAMFRQANDPVGLSRALRQTAMARAMPGPLDADILAMAEEAVALLRHLAPHKDLATALAHLGSVHFIAGDRDVARRLNEAALAMRRGLGDSTGMLASSVNLAEILFLEGDVAGALRHAAEAEAEARRRNALATLALILSNMAGYRLHDDDQAGGMRAAVEALRHSRAIGQDYLAVMSLEHIALALAMGGALDTAAGLLGFTDAHYGASGQTREPLEQTGHDRLQAILRARLPPLHLAALHAAGCGWTQQAADAATRQDLLPA